ncbi:sigma-70 family RNA polymerase sigma factor [Roseimaritima ulvae]|uniref:RNA polymerase sigma factor SigA n=1 Tax=Roseimaritima ulvae TaxID=980254 RepID=A0A5B9QXI4_9BACT|nr:sigma-70 family RNA polymerase sigma factor [Roseimaritima ulvae]QEG42712.1 RNA polymerase sigma factor SigA [Roseimaritima ulvae]
MHEEYRDDNVKQLRDQQVRFAPRAKKLEQATRAEQLLSELDDSRDYAFNFVCFRITDYRPETSTRRTIRGADLRHDLRLFVEDMSEAADVQVEEANELVHTVADLSRLFNVSTKTISRWRDQGLVSRRFLVGGRKRVGFLQSSVDRFIAQNRDRIRRGERFSQLTDEEKGEIIERGRQLAEDGASLSEVTRQLASQMNRSPETVRYTLKNYDAENAALAIFPNHRGTLTEEDKRSIFQQFHRGATVPQLCKRYGRSRSSVQRILVDVRVARTMELPLDYMYNEDFEDASRRDEYLGEMPEAEKPTRKARVPSGLPPYLAALYEVPLLNREQEYHLFRKMNYLKHLASQLREGLDQAHDRSAMMDEIHQLYEQAVAVKNKIVQSNLRLVVSIAKRHMSSTDDFFALVSDGNMSLIRAAEKFDYGRGNKFSTYATWAIMKNFARTIPSEFKHRDRFRTTAEELFLAQSDDRSNPFVEESSQRQRQREVGRILNRLDEREQKIISARFGLTKGSEPLTLKQVGEEMGVTKERIRQLEARALLKLREAAADAKIDVDLGN